MSRIFATLATIKEREQFFYRVCQDLHKQVHGIQAYLNDYDEPPAWQHDFPNLKLFMAQDEDGDLGDAGKFYKHDQPDSFYVVVDDDLFYPSDFVAVLIDGIERYDFAAAVTLHGRILNPMLNNRFTSYYRDPRAALVQCRTLDHVFKDTVIHCPGTNAFAYHTDTITFDIADFKRYWPKGRNMGDIWSGIKCREQGVPVVCLAHAGGWVRHQPIDLSRTIYEWEKDRDEDQTRAINEFGPWLLPKPLEPVNAQL
jgi:hypothetical protein